MITQKNDNFAAVLQFNNNLTTVTMKKFYMMFAAIITLAAMSFVSCDDDDNDKYSTYYLVTEVDCGSLTGDAAESLKKLEGTQDGTYKSDDEAISKYYTIVEEGKSSIEVAMQLIYVATGQKDFAVYIKLLNSNKQVLKTTKISLE